MPKFDEIKQRSLKFGQARILTEEDIRDITNDIVHGNWARRAESTKLTGEWLMFSKFDGKNYYLGIITHNKEENKKLSV